MSSSSVSVRKDVLQALVRVAIAALDQPGATVAVPTVVGVPWLRRHVTRLHARGAGRYSVEMRTPTLVTITRRQSVLASPPSEAP